MRALLAMSLLALALPAAALAQPGAAHADARVTERALVLAQTLNSEAIIVGDDKDDAKAVALMDQLTQGNAELLEFDKQYPGIVREMAWAAMPIINRSARERLPQLWSRQAALYAQTFNATELDTLIAFYQSPTGVKLIGALMANVQPDHAIAEAAKSEDFSISGTSVIQDIRASMPKVMGEMNDADRAALVKLMATGLLPRLQTISVRTQEIALAWFDESAPWEEAETDKAIAAVIEGRMGGKE